MLLTIAAAWYLTCPGAVTPAQPFPTDDAKLSSGVALARELVRAGQAGLQMAHQQHHNTTPESSELRPVAATDLVPDNYKGRIPVPLDSRVGPNLRTGLNPPELQFEQRQQSEPHITAHPTDATTLLATFQEGRRSDGGAACCGYALSTDGGSSWNRALIPGLTQVSGGRWFRATDPVAVIGTDGTLYLNTLVSRSADFTLGDLVVSRSQDGGRTWSDPLVAYQGPNAQLFPDKNWMAINPYPGTATFNRLVITYTAFTYNAAGQTISNHIQALTSRDQGTTWSQPVSITPVGSSNQGSIPLFLPDGTLIVVYFTFAGSSANNGRVDCKRSTDGGATWPSAERTVIANVSCYDDPETRDGVFLPAATTARDTGTIFVAMSLLQQSQPRIVVVRSADGGQTWSAPVTVSDNPTGAGVMNPSIAASPDGRTVLVTFYDKRHGPGFSNYVDLYGALSLDAGTTWSHNIRLTDLSSDVRLAQPTSRGFMLGDYLGLTTGERLGEFQKFTAIWCDTRYGESDPFTVNFAAAAGGSFESWLTAQLAPAQQRVASHEQDLDDDGLSLLQEWALGRSPTVADGQSPFMAQATASGLEVYHAFRRHPDLSVRWEKSSDGNNWSDTTFFSRLEDMPPIQMDAVELAGGTFQTLPNERAWFRPRFILQPQGTTTARTSPLGETLLRAAKTRLGNLSVRGLVKSGENQLIAGFVVDGGTLPVLLRGVGPSLAPLGILGPLSDPFLTARASGSDLLLAENDNWMTVDSPHPPPPLLATLMNRVGAFPLSSGYEAALLLQCNPGGVTATLRHAKNGMGTGLVEIYDARDAAEGGSLRNFSARGDTSEGLIAGFVIHGPDPCRVLIRSVGPSLSLLGVEKALADPCLRVYRSGSSAPVAANDDWCRDADPSVARATAVRVGAFPISEASLDAALVLTLLPGAYTVTVESTNANSPSGIALLEIYDASLSIP